ncbi:mannitol-1-phosphate 5-dehydrogenase [Protaetiibacter mangrovi]|uniref:Mannitol-1-phosphate 5-dehydrogenase n=1 Tax=Protaetiibacter mangrovi TaxID=2970926 RepID=A0ABT1ZHT6_9MICO|nr:mannitol-1-phosphate 5-dehydrogenase [Protaetiibacter mangrovi]MCS0500279.1 mannitol-1-phosphate 5-dehydrogenase [Protaetiibacter mangrovi]TPX02426.1 mannitol-1-phosphate 5-dehydrogenase [Schumannella luteola]
MTATAVHFGAGNIGRGFVAPFLRQSGYEVVFADVSEELIGALQAQPSYRVHEVGEGARDLVIDGYRAINSREHPDDVAAEIAAAEVVTTAVGARILQFVAPLIVAGLAQRPADAKPLVVIACENAIGGTDILAEAVRGLGGAMERAVWANCAIDRIVPEQHGGLDVTLEAFWEWAVDRTPFGGDEPEIVGVHWVDDLEPYIERKLFTVNTGHASTAYLGYHRGIDTIAEALAVPEVMAEVRAVLAETSGLLVAKHGFTAEEQQGYVETTLARITNPELPDSCVRVGRAPLRKLGRHERFIDPAAQLVERGEPAWNLLTAVGAALRFDPADDPEAVELQAALASGADASALAAQLCGIEPGHPLHEPLVEVFRLRLES